jgi:hypothetical protein
MFSVPMLTYLAFDDEEHLLSDGPDFDDLFSSSK